MNIFIETVERFSGGYLSYVRGLLQSIRSVEANIVINCTQEMSELIGQSDKKINFITTNNPCNTLSSRYIFQKKILPKILYDYDIDLIFNTSSSMDFFQPVTIPVVATCLNIHPFCRSEVQKYGFSKFRMKLEVLKIAMMRTFERSDGVIFHSDFSKELVLSNVKIDNCVVIPTGIRDEFYQKPLKKSFDFLEPIRILYISSFFLYKHQWEVIKAVDKLRKDTGRDVRLKLIGNGEYHATKKISDCLKILSFPNFVEILDNLPTPYTGIVDEYKACDIFVFASSCENLPNNLLEAMAAGNPIACSNVEPMPSLLQNGGEFFSPFDYRSIAGSIQKIIDDPNNSLMNAKCAYNLSLNYTWKSCSDLTFKYFESFK